MIPNAYVQESSNFWTWNTETPLALEAARPQTLDLLVLALNNLVILLLCVIQTAFPVWAID